MQELVGYKWRQFPWKRSVEFPPVLRIRASGMWFFRLPWLCIMATGTKEGLTLVVVLLLCFNSVVLSATDPRDYAILDEFRKGLENPELLEWPREGADPCGSKWPNVYCQNDRVSQIQVQGFGLKGTLPQNLNQLEMLSNIGLQSNSFTGKLPSFSGLSNLQFAYLDNNQFDTIPSDFFVGLTALRALSLHNNPLNQSTGWVFPRDLENSLSLTNLSMMLCNLVGPLPDFLGRMYSLTSLKLSYNRLTGEIPASFQGSILQTLWLNNQVGTGLTGPIDVLASMKSLTSVWLHGNGFTGTIPEGITACTYLEELDLNSNQLVGLIPKNMTDLKQLKTLRLDNNKLMGPIPSLRILNFSFSDNSFCQATPGAACSPEVDALLDFLGGVNYPLDLATSWSGNDPCIVSWLGVSCADNKVNAINLPDRKLNGTISPSIANLDSLQDITLQGNNLYGTVPQDLARLESLRLLNLTSNNLRPPLPDFNSNVIVLIDQNPLFNSCSKSPPSGSGNKSPAPSGNNSPPRSVHPNSRGRKGTRRKLSPKSIFLIVLIVVGALVVIVVIAVIVIYYYCYRRKKSGAGESSKPDHPGGETSGPDHPGESSTPFQSRESGVSSEEHVFEFEVLKKATGNFAHKNELGRGGFGTVYKGELGDGRIIAVKKMQTSASESHNLANVGQYQSEIALLSKVRHRNLVSVLGYSVKGRERLLVYEYMENGDLSKHLFNWRTWNLNPLSWEIRFSIALDVARGMEYLHSFAGQCFIHRDLKSQNILLDNDFRAKVADFGLVKPTPDGNVSLQTRPAGTLGYVAPEYASKVTTKIDVYSFGVVLMQLITGMRARDFDRPEESQLLATRFSSIKSSREKLRAALDKSLEVSDETFRSISTIAELAGHCTERDRHRRPDMAHAVTVLSPLVHEWKPAEREPEENLGGNLNRPPVRDRNLNRRQVRDTNLNRPVVPDSNLNRRQVRDSNEDRPLLDMVKAWKNADERGSSSLGGLDHGSSSSSRPPGFPDSFAFKKVGE